MNRRITAALAAAAALVTLAACGSSDSDGGSADTAAFSFTDDLGTTLAAARWAFSAWAPRAANSFERSNSQNVTGVPSWRQRALVQP